MYDDIERLVGKKVLKIYMNEDFLKFETDKGNVVYCVEGDCCSSSYFHDFIGVKKLLENGPVISAKSIELDENTQTYDETEKETKTWGEIRCYGFEIVTENPVYGEQTSVFSFRNSSNGYYGGSLCNEKDDTEVLPEVIDDVIEAANQPLNSDKG
jgi:hypothetical protein